jgi:hypothetical protein
MERFSVAALAESRPLHPYEAHRAPDLPVPVDEPMPEPQPAHPHHPHGPADDEPVPDHKPE